MPKTKKNLKKHAKTKTIKIRKKVFPKITKLQLTKIIYNISLDDAIADFNKLKNIECNEINNSSKVGSDFVNYFTAIERLNTKGRLKISFFDTYYNFNELYNTKPHFRNGINSVYNNKFFDFDERERLRYLKYFFSLYIGNVGLFRPIIAKEVICLYKPKHMLDFTMGWGGRLAAACATNIETYIGIDLNTNLKPLYKKMVDTLSKLSTTKIKLYFKNALDIDYSKLNYDMVLTSPPYFNIEIYNKSKVMKKNEWKEDFYIPIFTKTFKHMKRRGHYCLNIPKYIYEDICIDLFGKCDEKITLNKGQKPKHEYKEYIYVWIKK